MALRWGEIRLSGFYPYGSIHRRGYNIQYSVSNLIKVQIQMDIVLVTFGYSTHLA